MKKCFKENTIVLIAFPFTNLTASKIRPALIIRDQVDDDLICCPISSIFNRTRDDIEIKESDTKGFVFPIKSVVRIQKIFTLNMSLVRKKIGSLENKTYKIIKSGLVEFLQT